MWFLFATPALAGSLSSSVGDGAQSVSDTTIVVTMESWEFVYNGAPDEADAGPAVDDVHVYARPTLPVDESAASWSFDHIDLQRLPLNRNLGNALSLVPGVRAVSVPNGIPTKATVYGGGGMAPVTPLGGVHRLR